MLLLHSWPHCGRPRQWIFPEQWGWVMSGEHNQLITIASYQLSLSSWGWLCGLSSHHCLPPGKRSWGGRATWMCLGDFCFWEDHAIEPWLTWKPTLWTVLTLNSQLSLFMSAGILKAYVTMPSPYYGFCYTFYFFSWDTWTWHFRKQSLFILISSFLNKLVHNIAHL